MLLVMAAVRVELWGNILRPARKQMKTAIKIARLFGKHVEEVFLYDESELAAPADTDY